MIGYSGQMRSVNLTNENHFVSGVLVTMFIGLVTISLGTLLMVFSPYDIIFPMVSVYCVVFCSEIWCIKYMDRVSPSGKSLGLEWAEMKLKEISGRGEFADWLRKELANLHFNKWDSI